MVNIVWTDLATEDLRSIFDYISRDSKVYAGRHVDKLILRVDQLESYSRSGRVVPEFNKEEIRELNRRRLPYSLPNKGQYSESVESSPFRPSVERAVVRAPAANNSFQTLARITNTLIHRITDNLHYEAINRPQRLTFND